MRPVELVRLGLARQGAVDMVHWNCSIGIAHPKTGPAPPPGSGPSPCVVQAETVTARMKREGVYMDR